MIPAADALTRLKDGNKRFAASLDHGVAPMKAMALPRPDQLPFAIILGCSDARVPAELVFDQGLGDLFVIRVAGNIIAPSIVGSVEFAAERFETRLVVVLGHEDCGAIRATVEELRKPDAQRSRNLQAITSRVRPVVEDLLEAGMKLEDGALEHAAVRAYIRTSVNHLRHGSDVLERLIDQSGLRVVGAEYSVETGVVGFLEG